VATRNQISEWIEQFLIDNWASTPIQFENIEPTDPNDPTKLLSDGSNPYLYVAIRYADSDAIEIGGSLSRTDGLIYIEVKIPEGSGTITGQTYIAALQTLLEYTNISDVKVRGSTSRDGFASGGWYILSTSFKFRYDR